MPILLKLMFVILAWTAIGVIAPVSVVAACNPSFSGCYSGCPSLSNCSDSHCESNCGNNYILNDTSYNCSPEDPACFPQDFAIRVCNCINPPQCSEIYNESACESSPRGCFWDTDIDECLIAPTPILINLQSNSATYRLTSAADGVWFDIWGQGVQQRLGWTRPGSEVGFLVVDQNGNGVIDDGSELLGSATLKSDGTRALHGFDALEDLDGGYGVSDGAITVADDAYARLAVWVDRNHNGVSEPDELLSLASAGVVELRTDYDRSQREDRHGNRYFLYGSSVVLNNGGQEQLRRVFDVLLTTQ